MADNFTGTNKGDDDRASEIVRDSIQTLEDASTERAPLNAQCEEIAALIQPSHVGSFGIMGQRTPYQKNTEQQIDSSGMLAADRFMAICDSMLTPKNQMWAGLTAGGPYADQLMKDRQTRMWFHNTTRKLNRYRYSPISNFVGQNQSNWHSLGCYGNGALFIDKFYDLNKKFQAIRYINIPFGEIYFEFNHQGVCDGFSRVMRYKARQAAKVPEFKGVLPEQVMTAAAHQPNKEYTFIHRVCPRDDYKPWRIDSYNMPYASYYICLETRTLMREGGYQSLPISATQYITAPGEQNGRSIAMSVLPSLKTLNAQKRVFLKQGHRAGDPVLLLADDGVMNMNLKPGAQNRGGWSADGKPLVGVLPAGEIQITDEMMDKEKALIDDAFLIALFAIAAEIKSGTTTTEIVERINEKGILIAPTLGRQEEHLARVVDREVDLLSQMGILDPMPPLLREAQGDYTVVFTSPLARSVRATEVSGFLRSVEVARTVAEITQDQSYLDPFDFDTALPEIAMIQGAPEPWMAAPDKIAQKREKRAKAAQLAQQIQAAPGAAAIMGAQAKQAAAGVQPGATA